jgi:hypothetical protein
MSLSDKKLICPKENCDTKLEIKMNPKNYWQCFCKKCNSNPDINDVLSANKM